MKDRRWKRRVYDDPAKAWEYHCPREHCKGVFRTLDQQKYHKKCHRKNELTYYCPECNNYSNTRWKIFQNHLWMKHKKDSGLYHCQQCGYKTESLSYFMLVHQPSHNSDRPFACEECGRAFKNRHLFQQHQVTSGHFKNAAFLSFK